MIRGLIDPEEAFYQIVRVLLNFAARAIHALRKGELFLGRMTSLGLRGSGSTYSDPCFIITGLGASYKGSVRLL